MSIPLDRLYNFIKDHGEAIFGDSVLIYRFWPHGSKNISNLTSLDKTNWLESTIHPAIFCHDQEPLNHSFYVHITPPDCGNNIYLVAAKRTGIFRPFKNLESQGCRGIFERGLLLHSEKRSLEIEKYLGDDQLIPVYYWSHALISLDWYRGAAHMNFIKTNKEKKCFLIYNRAWSGTREYRFKFLDLLISQNLVDHCHTTFNDIDPESQLHYLDYEFKNTTWRPQNTLDGYFPTTSAAGDASADFSISDYTGTEIEIVLETLFDDTRLHLTEKSLRPIACGQPFIIAATHGSLQYLRDYGFRTFDTVWDESYDLITDPATRLEAVVKTMKTISQWDAETKAMKMQQAKEITDYNKKWFFNQDFFSSILNELDQNLAHAFHELDHNTPHNYSKFIAAWNRILPFEEIQNDLKTNKNPMRATMQDLELAIGICQQRLQYGRK
jgi:hypothetical protein